MFSTDRHSVVSTVDQIISKPRFRDFLGADMTSRLRSIRYIECVHV
jgi:hypothetical protein